MELYFLGTVAGMPSKERNVTSIVLKLLEERGSYWMFDCGEGTQHQVLKSPIKLSKLEKLFITHLHGDHIYGLPGLLTSRSYQGGDSPLHIFGPAGIKAFIENALTISQAHLDYELQIHEITNEGIVFQDTQFVVRCDRLEHRIECFGYRIEEQAIPGRLNDERLKAEGIAPGPVYARLKKGEDITLEDGRVLKAEDYQGLPIPGRTITVLGDTRICDSGKRLAEKADVLVHEATFNDALKELAFNYYHSTSKQAAELAHTMGVGTLIMTHISSRFQGHVDQDLLAEACQIHPNSFIAEDFWSYYIPRKVAGDR